jgi:hypothetical protein
MERVLDLAASDEGGPMVQTICEHHLKTSLSPYQELPCIFGFLRMYGAASRLLRFLNFAHVD